MGELKTRNATASDGATRLIYLISYNLFQCVGWAFVLILTLSHFANKQTYIGVYWHVSFYLLFFQSLQGVELLHIIVGAVKTPLLTTFIQIGSRIMVIWGILDAVPEVTNNFSVSMLIIAWCIAEITRYLFYASSLLGRIPYLLHWCRYNFFLVLYPIGITGEILSLIAALPYIKARETYSLNLPNVFNLSFSFYYFTIAILLVYIPGFPVLLSHMLAQRRNFLSGKYKVKKAN